MLKWSFISQGHIRNCSRPHLHITYVATVPAFFAGASDGLPCMWPAFAGGMVKKEHERWEISQERLEGFTVQPCISLEKSIVKAGPERTVSKFFLGKRKQLHPGPTRTACKIQCQLTRGDFMRFQDFACAPTYADLRIAGFTCAHSLMTTSLLTTWRGVCSVAQVESARQYRKNLWVGNLEPFPCTTQARSPQDAPVPPVFLNRCCGKLLVKC